MPFIDETIIMKKVSTSVCIFCGSRSGINANFKREAKLLAQALTKSEIEINYGGGGSGIMGAVASEVIKNEGKILGIIPKFLKKREQHSGNICETVITANMHERKKLMYEKSSAFIVMPGGIGTLEEACEIITWKILRLHNKPIIFINTDQFWMPFFNLIDHIADNMFIEKDSTTYYKIAKDTQETLLFLKESNLIVS